MQVTKGFNYYVEGRLFEWTMALTTLFSGIQFAIWEDSIEDSTFQFLLLIMQKYEAIFLLIVLGWSRGTALILNGQRLFGYKVGPWVRAGCCVASAMIWVQFVFALLLLSISLGSPAAGLPYWIMFTIAELYAAYSVVKNG